MVQLPQNKKQTCQLKSSPKMSPSDLTMAMTLTLNFQGQILNLLYVSQKWPDCHETKNKHIDWPQGLKWNIMFHLDHNLELEFSRSNMEFAISHPKWSSCHKMKNKHIDRTEGLKFYHCVWHWTCPWKVRWPGWLKMPACHWFIVTTPHVTNSLNWLNQVSRGPHFLISYSYDNYLLSNFGASDMMFYQ